MTRDSFELRNFSDLKPLIWFFLLAYAIAWSVAFGVGIDPELIQATYSPLRAFVLITLPKFAFSLAGLIMIMVSKGYVGLRELGSRLFRWKVGFKWYALAYFGPAVLYGLGVLFFGMLEPSIFASFTWNSNSFWMFLFGADTGILTYMFLRGGLGEEIGLRGFALPELQKRFSPLLSSLILGVLWAVWHLPAWWQRDLLSILIPFLAVIALSIIFTYVFNNSAESLGIIILLHASLNSFDDVYEMLFPNLISQGLWELPYILSVVIIGTALAFRLKGKSKP